ncbi:unnamed protein product [Amoebophrya sp. A120]|nr:unnamed protein product [Amoebophrya sp. A120]|eukprot:GSA120T00021143001.1
MSKTITIFLKLPHFDEQICRELELPQTIQQLKKQLDVGTGQELVVSHPKFPEQFSLVEAVKQLYDGCNIKLIVPKRRLFVKEILARTAEQQVGSSTTTTLSDEMFAEAAASANTTTSSFTPVVWYPGATVDDIERAVFTALGYNDSNKFIANSEYKFYAAEGDREVLSLSTSLPQDTKILLRILKSNLEVHHSTSSRPGLQARSSAASPGQLQAATQLHQQIKSGPAGTASSLYQQQQLHASGRSSPKGSGGGAAAGLGSSSSPATGAESNRYSRDFNRTINPNQASNRFPQPGTTVAASSSGTGRKSLRASRGEQNAFRPASRTAHNNKSLASSTSGAGGPPPVATSFSADGGYNSGQSRRQNSKSAMLKARSISKLDTLKDGSTPLRVSDSDENCVHILQGHTGFVLSLCVVGDVLFTGSQDSTIMIWDLNNLQYIGTLPGHRGFVKCLDSSYAKKVLISGSSDKTLKVWSLETFSCQKTLSGQHTDEVHCVKVLDTIFISGSEDKTMRVWDLVTYEALLVVENAHTSGIFSIQQLAPNILMTGGRDRTIKLWNTADKWSLLKPLLPPHYDGVTSLAVSRKLKKMYSVSRDRSIKQWNVNSLENESQQLHIHADWITCCCMDPEEERLITGSKDCVVKVWNAENLQCLDAFVGHRGPVSSVLCMRDYLFSGSHDRTVRVWRMSDRAVDVSAGGLVPQGV